MASTTQHERVLEKRIVAISAQCNLCEGHEPKDLIGCRPRAWAQRQVCALLTSLLLFAGASAYAQQTCSQEIEPNDQIDQAKTLTGALCFQGDIQNDAQDRFIWAIPTSEGAHGWRVDYGGGYATARVVIQSIKPTNGAAPQSEGAELLRLDVGEGSYGERSPEFLLQPGTYLVNVLANGVSPYQLRITPNPPEAVEAEPNDTPEQATPLLMDKVISGAVLTDPDLFTFTLSPDQAMHHWTLQINGALGSYIATELLNQQGESLLRVGQTISRMMEIDDLGLAAGTYNLKITPSSDVENPYTLRLIAQGPRLPSREDEPNDTPATAFALTPGRSVIGKLGHDGDSDSYAFDVTAAMQGKLMDVAVKSKSQRSLCLTVAAGIQLQCRTTTSPGLPGISLAVGHYLLTVSGTAYPDEPYQIGLRFSGRKRRNAEAEPNDVMGFATSIGKDLPLEAKLAPGDVDYFKLHVEGEPRLWSFSTVGPAVDAVTVLDFAETQLGSGARVEGTQGASANNVFLLPGDYWIRISGTTGAYVLTASVTGVPDRGSEREPNNSDDQAQRLAFGQAIKGSVSDSSDRDVFRFSLFAQDHVRLTVTPTGGDPVAVELEWGYPSPKRPQGSAGTLPFVYEALLDPGDYILRLKSDKSSPSPYQVDLARLDPFGLPDDLEPNDTPGQARPLPDTLGASGVVTPYLDDDWYRLPDLTTDTRLHVVVTGAVTISLIDGDAAVENLSQDSGEFEADVAAGHPLRLGVKGEGNYRLTVGFAAGLAPKAAMPILPVTMSMQLDSPSVAAFWIRGQWLHGALQLKNIGATERNLSLRVISSHFDYVPVLDAPTVTMAPGASATIPVYIAVAPDAWSNQEVNFAARATADTGEWASATTKLVADLATPPVNQETSFPLPNAMLGGFNVASAALGGLMTLTDDSTGEKPGFLQDGLVGDGNVGIFAIDASLLPYEITVRFGADHPWTIAGITIHPQGTGRIYPAEQLQDFDLLLSEDGINFTQAVSGRMTMLPIEQAFTLGHPMPARAARLRLKSNHADNLGKVGLGEWKVITVPGEPKGLSADMAEASRGGHVVWSNMVIGASADDQRAMLGGLISIPIPMPAGSAPQWVVGFNEDRAAQITALEWQDGKIAADLHAIGAVKIDVSRDGPFGPWEALPPWQIVAGPHGVARLDLAAPVWARFVRFTATEKPLADTRWAMPMALRIFERPVQGNYLSILGEWGQYNRAAIYESQMPVPTEIASAPVSHRQTKASAEPLPIGAVVAGEVKLDTTEDWFAIDVPLDVNRLTMTASGEPTVDVDMELQDTAGGSVKLLQLPSSADRLRFEAEVDAGARYFLRVHEPQRSVAVAYDISPSLSNFASIIRHAMAAFASGVVPGREFVNFMTFASPFILKDWTDQPWVLEGAILAKQDANQMDSSDLWQTLTLVGQALALRRGVRAAIIVTDAQTPGYDTETAIWAELGKLRPRIFAAHIGAGDDPQREKQVMQDLASINGGYYTSARTQAEMDVVADRAAAWLRRPTRYQLVATVRKDVPPDPGTLHIRMAEKPATLTGPAAAAPITVAIPAEGAIEVILDASGSMLKKLNGERRIETAHKVLDTLVSEILSVGQPLAFRVFGNDKAGSCETHLVAPLGPLDPDEMIKKIRKIKAINRSRTPIAASLAAVADDLGAGSGLRTVVLVTDGEETCGGDPAAEIAKLRTLGFDVRVNIVGFAVDNPALKSTFNAWATAGGGSYFDASDKAALGVALAAAVAPPVLPPPFKVIGSDGATVAEGTIGGADITLPAGTYQIQVGTDGTAAIKDVVIDPGTMTEVDFAPN